MQLERVEVLEKRRQVALRVSGSMLGLRGRRFGLAQLDHHPEILELLLGLEQRLDLARGGRWPRRSVSGPARGCSRNCPRAISASISPRRCCAPGTSKKPPQVREFLGGDGHLGFDGVEHSAAEPTGSAQAVQTWNVHGIETGCVAAKQTCSGGTFGFEMVGVVESVFKVAAGLPACRGGRQLAARNNRPHDAAFTFYRAFSPGNASSAGLEATALRQPRWLTLQFSNRL